MVDVRPFRGIRYNTQAVGDLSKVICPPYDVISPTQQRALLDRSPHNAVRLELPPALPEDTDTSNLYKRTALLWEQWQREGVLTPEPRPAMYLVEEEFLDRGQQRARMGLIVSLRLEEFEKGIVLPHEHTTPGPKADRMQMMRACQANFSPAMGLYRDPTGIITPLLADARKAEPTASAKVEGQGAVRMWAVQREETLSAIRSALADDNIFIADGHHRYETALTYRDSMATPASANAASNFILVTLISMEDPGLLLLPYHRLLGGLSPGEMDSLQGRLREMFSWDEVDLPDADSAKISKAIMRRLEQVKPEQMALGAYMGLEKKAYILTLKESLAPETGASPLQRCDYWVLSQRVLEPALGVERAAAATTFIHEDVEAIDAVARGHQAALLMRALPMELFEGVVSGGDRLPPKSTFFYPKLTTGLVFHSLVGEV